MINILALMGAKNYTKMNSEQILLLDFASNILANGGPNPRQGKKTDNAHPPIHPIKYVDSLQVSFLLSIISIQVVPVFIFLFNSC